MHRGATRLVARIIQAGGVSIVLLSVLLDVLWSKSSPGFGLQQLILLVAGSAVVVAGMWITPDGRSRVQTAGRALFGGPTRLPPRQILLLALLFGMAAGLAETAILFGEKLLTGRMLWMGEEAAWILPLVDSAVLTVVALFIVALGVVVPQLRSVHVVGFLFSLLCVDVIVDRFTLGERLDGLSRGVFVIGASVVVTRWLRERHETTSPVRLKWVGALAGIVLLLGAGFAIGRMVRERVVLSRLVDAAGGAPNILFVIWDTVRATNLSLYGYERPTSPRLEELARGATTFDLAIASASWTLPSHASMFTGRDPDRLNANWLDPLDDAHPTLASVLADHGWATAGFSANLSYVTREAGLARGFAHFADYHTSPRRMVSMARMTRRNLERVGLLTGRKAATIGLKSGAQITGQVLDWLDGRPVERPFFVFANYMDAHDPYNSPPPYRTMYGDEPDIFNLRWDAFLSSATSPIEPQVAAYDACITFLDDQLRALLDGMQGRGLLDNTIIVVASDHGEHFGEHGFMRHGGTLYLPVLHVPLVIRAPGVPEGLRVAREVTLRDLPATLLDLAGVDAGDRIGGASLRAVWEDTTRNRDWLYSEVRQGVRHPPELPNSEGNIHSLIRRGYHFIRRTDNGLEELYDYRSDPGENLNLVEAGAADSILRVARRVLQQRLASLARDGDRAQTAASRDALPSAGVRTR